MFVTVLYSFKAAVRLNKKANENICIFTYDKKDQLRSHAMVSRSESGIIVNKDTVEKQWRNKKDMFAN